MNKSEECGPMATNDHQQQEQQNQEQEQEQEYQQQPQIYDTSLKEEQNEEEEEEKETNEKEKEEIHQNDLSDSLNVAQDSSGANEEFNSGFTLFYLFI
jgi:hypothetical protein